VTDGAQVPNEMAAAKTQVDIPDWPSNRAGLSYLWQNARARNVIIDERIGLPVATALGTFSHHQLSVPARFNRFGAALAAGGNVENLGDGKPEVFEMATLPNTRPHHPDPHKNIWSGTFESHRTRHCKIQ